MVFSNNFFILAFLPLFFLAYYISPHKHKNIILLIASIFFYTWGAPKFIFILLFSLFIDFYLVKIINNTENKWKKCALFFSVLLNITLLAYFKYANFFIDNLNAVLNHYHTDNIYWTEIALPIGISFITFHKLTYAIDAYRNVHRPLEKFSDYVLYILMFPHQIAGPIVRFNEIASQIENRETEYSIDNRLEGMFRFVVGLSKKVLIANPLGNVANTVFALNIHDMSSFTAWVGILAYTFQIYFDFSGYSDMAIGLAKMMGFTFPENFNFPYISQNITEFWRRWHITLGRFMKDYLYIPLGGNKVSKYQLLLNLWIVFLVSGLWHGASWTFVVWGAYHGLLLIIDRLFFIKLSSKFFTVINISITFLLVVIGWVFFRATDFQFALDFIKKLFSFATITAIQPVFELRFWVMFVIAILISFFPLMKLNMNKTETRFSKIILIFRGAMLLLLLIICISDINGSGFNPFIYFRF